MAKINIGLIYWYNKWGPAITYENIINALKYCKNENYDSYNLDPKAYVIFPREFSISYHNYKYSNNCYKFLASRNNIKKITELIVILYYILKYNDIIVVSDPIFLTPLTCIMKKILNLILRRKVKVIFLPLGFYMIEVHANLFCVPRHRYVLEKILLKIAEILIYYLSDLIVFPDKRFPKLVKYLRTPYLLWPTFGVVRIDEKQRSSLDKNNSEIVILFAGRLNEHSGFDKFIDIVNDICREDNNIRFVVVGEGKLKHVIQKISTTNPNVIYLGYLNNEDFMKVMKEADIILLLNREPLCGLSNTLLESMSSGLVVISTNVGMRNLLINNGYNGFIISSLNDIKYIIKQLNNGDIDMKKIRQNAIRTVKLLCSYRSFCKIFLKILVKLKGL